MNDDNEMIFPPGVPEELQEKIKAMFDKQKMAGLVTRQAISRFFQELDSEQLQTLKLILNFCSNNPAAAAFYEGFIGGLLAQKFNKWPGWDDEPNDAVVSFTFDPTDGSFTAEEVAMHPAFQDTDDDPDAALYERYNVEPSDEDGDERVRCLGCGTVYVSLQDRMLRPAGSEGCSVCVQKAKWG